MKGKKSLSFVSQTAEIDQTFNGPLSSQTPPNITAWIARHRRENTEPVCLFAHVPLYIQGSSRQEKWCQSCLCMKQQQRSGVYLETEALGGRRPAASASPAPETLTLESVDFLVLVREHSGLYTALKIALV